MPIFNKKSKKLAKAKLHTSPKLGSGTSKNPWARPLPPNLPLNIFVPSPPEPPLKTMKNSLTVSKPGTGGPYAQPLAQLPEPLTGAQLASKSSPSPVLPTKIETITTLARNKPQETIVRPGPPAATLKTALGLPKWISGRPYAETQMEHKPTSTSTQQASNASTSPCPLPKNETMSNPIQHKTTTIITSSEPTEQTFKVRRIETITRRKQFIRTDRYGVKHVIELKPVVTKEVTERTELKQIEKAKNESVTKTKEVVEEVEGNGRGKVRIVGPGADQKLNKTWMGDTVPLFGPGMVLAMAPKEEI